jgi:methyl-accepting chemotaxis protein
MREFLRTHQYPFPVLSDVRREVVKAYGVYVRVNFESVNISRPAECVIDKDGVVRYMYIGRIQTDFPPDGQILTVLDELKG